MTDNFAAAIQQLTAEGPFAITTTEVRGIPLRAYAAAPPNMRFVWEMSAAHGDAEYIVYNDERYSYADTHARVRSLAHALADTYGIKRGDRVAVSMRNYPEWIMSYWAITSLGAAIVGMNAWWTGPEMEYGLRDASPKVLICDRERLHNVEPHLSTLRSEHQLDLIVVRVDQAAELPDGAAHWNDIVDPATAPAALPEAHIDPDDDACIFYTSGTTGFPKGAQLTHRGTVANLMNMAVMPTAAALAKQMSGMEVPDPASAPTPSVLLPVPLFHVTGCNCVLHPITLAGGKLVSMY
ncbi:MAG: acyl--CoA ligase, partial [Acidimicrobiales bacterium]|nr:acyl--CoA ligase [Acidimicrobiales bacterium]